MAQDSAVRVEMAIRSAMLGKAALDIMGSQPFTARLQLREVMKQAQDFQNYLKDKENV